VTLRWERQSCLSLSEREEDRQECLSHDLLEHLRKHKLKFELC
jgi:hypothetical protein